MQLDLNKIKKYFMEISCFVDMMKLPSLKLFDDRVCDMLNELSVAIRNDDEAKKYPDIVTFGFFCRKSNLQKLKQQYYSDDRIGRGLSFHIAPSNVPINFAYSFAAGLLAGNPCIVRASSKNFEQTRIISRLLYQLKKESDIKKYLAVIGYDHDKEMTDYFSALASTRIIWGGDITIQEIRKSPIQPRCSEITFADRYSICVVHAKNLMNIENLEPVFRSFYNDTYLYDQNACSSPRLLYWVGSEDKVEQAKILFWNGMQMYLSNRYSVEPVIAIDKLMKDYKAAIEIPGTIIKKTNNVIHRIVVNVLPENLSDYVCPGGSFVEYASEGLDALLPVITDKYQTMTYIGFEGRELADWVIKNGLSGIDRIVPVGKAADFTLTWDGYNLIDCLSRNVYYERSRTDTV